jgi:hypothetical protein
MVESPIKLCFPKSFNTIQIESDESNANSIKKEIILRAALHNKDEVKKWLKDYSNVTRSDWIVKKADGDMQR